MAHRQFAMASVLQGVIIKARTMMISGAKSGIVTTPMASCQSSITPALLSLLLRAICLSILRTGERKARHIPTVAVHLLPRRHFGLSADHSTFPSNKPTIHGSRQHRPPRIEATAYITQHGGWPVIDNLKSEHSALLCTSSPQK